MVSKEAKRLMNMWKAGTKVVYCNPENGWECDREHAEHYLTLGAEYTVAQVDVSSWQTNIYLEEVDRNVAFNNVLFCVKDG